MKQALFSLAPLLSAAALFAAEPASPTETVAPKGFPVTHISVDKISSVARAGVEQRIKVGTPLRQVERLLGKPSAELAPGLVRYDNCRPDQEQASQCELLLIRYEMGVVAELIFANAPMAEQIALQTLQKQTPETKDLPSALALPN